MGDPSRSKPSLQTGMEGRRGLFEKETSIGTQRWDLLQFKRIPREGPSDSMMARAEQRSPTEPQRVPLSRYQALIRRLGTSSQLWGVGQGQTPVDPRGRLVEHHNS